LFGKQFPVWSQNGTGMLQHAVWTSFTLEGLGASLQHNGAYSEGIVAEILKTFGLPQSWTSTAIMPFGDPAAPPAEKKFSPIENRVKVLKA
jgi:predicted oxidoreductase (fatty acid repression mutant protein)